MNHAMIGTADKTHQFLEWADKNCLLIDDGPIAEAFLDYFPRAHLFDITAHSFNPLRDIDYKGARDFATTVYTASPEGKDTLTVRNGKRALVRLLLQAPRIDKLSRHDDGDPGALEALATIDDLLLSRVLKSVLCRNPNFLFKGMIVAKLDRAEIGDFDAFLLASLLISQAKGQVIVPDFGFYARDIHLSLIRQNRLVAGVNFFDELSPRLRNAVLLLKDKVGQQCTAADAEILAQFAGLTANTTAFTDFIHNAVGAQ